LSKCSEYTASDSLITGHNLEIGNAGC